MVSLSTEALDEIGIIIYQSITLSQYGVSLVLYELCTLMPVILVSVVTLVIMLLMVNGIL